MVSYEQPQAVRSMSHEKHILDALSRCQLSRSQFQLKIHAPDHRPGSAVRPGRKEKQAESSRAAERLTRSDKNMICSPLIRLHALVASSRMLCLPPEDCSRIPSGGTVSE